MTNALALALALSIWGNSPDGQQREFIRLPLPSPVCLAAQAAIWRLPFPTIGEDELGPLPSYDAACLPEGERNG